MNRKTNKVVLHGAALRSYCERRMRELPPGSAAWVFYSTSMDLGVLEIRCDSPAERCPDCEMVVGVGECPNCR